MSTNCLEFVCAEAECSLLCDVSIRCVFSVSGTGKHDIRAPTVEHMSFEHKSVELSTKPLNTLIFAHRVEYRYNSIHKTISWSTHWTLRTRF